jgi:hypothetical protein
MPDKGNIHMQRANVIEEVIEYFRSPQWRDVLSVVQERDMNHMHVYVDTYLDLGSSFRPLVDGFFSRLGWPAYRPIDIMADKPGRAGLYGIQLEDKLNFEIYCRLNQQTVLRPMVASQGERGGNLRVWSVADIRRFHEQFHWRDLSAADREQVAKFFRDGSHWQRALDYVRDPDVMHVHCNVETSVHPNILRAYALDDLAHRGFTVKHAIHSIFNGGGYDSGKIIFLGLNPRRTYDIAYYHNTDVLLQVNTQETRMVGGAGTGNEFFVVRVSTLQEELAKHALIRLTDEEISSVLSTVCGFYQRSAYSWRIVPAAAVNEPQVGW